MKIRVVNKMKKKEEKKYLKFSQVKRILHNQLKKRRKDFKKYAKKEAKFNYA